MNYYLSSIVIVALVIGLLVFLGYQFGKFDVTVKPDSIVLHKHVTEIPKLSPMAVRAHERFSQWIFFSQWKPIVGWWQIWLEDEALPMNYYYWFDGINYLRRPGGAPIKGMQMLDGDRYRGLAFDPAQTSGAA